MKVQILVGDCRALLRSMPEESIHCAIISPPYFALRSYAIEPTVWGGDPEHDHEFSDLTIPQRTHGFCACGAWSGQLGLEPDFRSFIEHTVEVFREVRRVLRKDGVLWLNVGDSYASGASGSGEFPGDWGNRPKPGASSWAGRGVPRRASHSDTVDPKSASRGGGLQPHVQPNRMQQPGFKPKDRMMIPARIAIALQEDGWWLRDEIIFSKPNPMPSSVEDRTTPAHEMVYLLSKSARYFFDNEAIKEPFSESTIVRLTQKNVANQPGGARQDLGQAQGVFERTGGRRPNEVVAGLAQKITRKPQGWAVGDGSHSVIDHNAATGGGAKYAGHREGESIWEGTSRNKRSVWTISTEPFSGEFCEACRTYYEGETLRALRVEEIDLGGGKVERRRHCACGKWDRWVSHFAAFPPRLVEPMVKAGTSEFGCCASCGSPWRRETESESFSGRPNSNSMRGHSPSSNRGSSPQRGTVYSKTETVGWAPTCSCGADVKPCVVMDPFSGTGTVGLVANRLQRDAVLLELGSSYAEMAARRIENEAGMLARVSVDDPSRREAAE